MDNIPQAPAGVNTSWKFLEGFYGFPSCQMQHVALPCDIELVILDFISPHTVHQSFTIERSPVMFSLHLSGHAKGVLRHSKIRQEPVACEPGKACISFNPGSSCDTTLMDNQHYQIINIYITRRELRQKLSGAYDQVPADFMAVLDSTRHSPYYRVLDISPQVRMITGQMIQCPYAGTLKTLYMESKSVELIVRLLWELNRDERQIPCPGVHPADRKQIHLAREKLLDDLSAPPRLKELARVAGLNETKLNRGFRQEFGMTVFEYYRRQRITRSKELLDQGRWNIDETAQLMGFYDTTHFIKQFKSHFGTTPGNYMKTARSGS